MSGPARAAASPRSRFCSGGLGHFALLWAKALGAEVYAISHTPEKEKDATALGAKGFISSLDKDWAQPWAFHFDFILNCADRYVNVTLIKVQSSDRTLGPTCSTWARTCPR